MGIMSGMIYAGRQEVASKILEKIDEQLALNKDKPEVRAPLLEVKETCREILDEQDPS